MSEVKLIAIASHKSPVNVVKLNKDGDLLFSASNDKNVIMYYSHSGERIGNFLCSGAVRSIDITRDSKYLITTTLNGYIELW